MDSDVRPAGLGGLLVGWVRRALGALVVAVTDLIVASVDAALALVPNPVPTAGQLRQARARRDERLRGVGRAARPARKPLLAGVGAGEWLVELLRPDGAVKA